jgi:hypothetical protein
MNPRTLLLIVIGAAIAVAFSSENWTVSGVCGGVALVAFAALCLLESGEDPTAGR